MLTAALWLLSWPPCLGRSRIQSVLYLGAESVFMGFRMHAVRSCILFGSRYIIVTVFFLKFMRRFESLRMVLFLLRML